MAKGDSHGASFSLSAGGCDPDPVAGLFRSTGASPGESRAGSSGGPAPAATGRTGGRPGSRAQKQAQQEAAEREKLAAQLQQVQADAEARTRAALKQIEDLKAQLAEAEKQGRKKDQTIRQLTVDLKQAKDQFDRILSNLNKKHLDDSTDLLRKKDELQALVDQLARDKDLIVKRADEERKKLEAELVRGKSDIENLKKQLQRREAEIAQLKQKPIDHPGLTPRTDWKIVRVEQDGKNAFINLGSADNVQDKLTFSVHGLDKDRKPLSTNKGSIEVSKVIGEHLSQVRITHIRDRARDPILQGDILCNPGWHPLRLRQVAIAGLAIFPGEKRNNLPELRRILERQGVVIDAWVDPNDGMKIKGRGINYKTDYLLLGDGLEPGQGIPTNEETRKSLKHVMENMLGEAKRNGVAIISLPRYLEMTGYQPRTRERPAPAPRTEPAKDQP